MECAQRYPTPALILLAKEQELRAILDSSARTQCTVERLYQAARTTFGFKRAVSALGIKIQSTAELLLFCIKIQHSLRKKIIDIAKPLSNPIFTIPGINYITGSMILAEIGDISRFTSAQEIVAYAGVDPTFYQSGEFTASRSRLSKRGSRYLRSALWMAAQISVRYDPQLKAYFQKKRGEGKHYSSAIGAICRKLLHRVWRILRDNRPYQVR